MPSRENFSREAMVSAALIFVSALVAFGVVFWLDRQIQAVANDAALNRLVIVQRARALETLAGLKQNAREVEAYREKMGTLLPSKEELLNFPEWLDEDARRNNVDVTFTWSSGINITAAGDQPGQDGFGLIITGKYEDIRNFLNRMENTSQRYVVVLDAFNLTGGSGGLFTLKSSGRVFSQ